MVDSGAKIKVLLDPCGDRQVKSCEPPPNKPLDQKVLFPYTGKICPFEI